MHARLAIICIATALILAIGSPIVRASDDKTLKGISAIYVLIEPLDDDARTLGLTVQVIQTDVELKLRLAGIRVVTEQESFTLPGAPYLYINVNVSDKNAVAANVQLNLNQVVLLARNGDSTIATTWYKAGVSSHPTAQSIRESIKDKVDAFLNAWLSVNPKK